MNKFVLGIVVSFLLMGTRESKLYIESIFIAYR